MREVTALILTKDEELHIARAIKSAQQVASEVLVVDSGSRDSTVTIAKDLGATVLFNPWTNHADQVNWALANLPSKRRWLLRLDADETISPDLVLRIKVALKNPNVAGFELGRQIKFFGRPIRFGGVGSVPTLRLFEAEKGYCESRWMDEHIVVNGGTSYLGAGLLDENLNSLTWWISKHNWYASLEAYQVILNKNEGFLGNKEGYRLGKIALVKRILKDRLYLSLPIGMRAGLYFFYRYVVRGGFLDGWPGLVFHFLQAFWFRFLVDAKVSEVLRFAKVNKLSELEAARVVLSIDP